MDNCPSVVCHEYDINHHYRGGDTTLSLRRHALGCNTLRVYIVAYAWIYLHAYMYVHAYMHACMYVYLHVCVCACTCMYVYMCMHMHMCGFMCRQTHMHAHTIVLPMTLFETTSEMRNLATLKCYIQITTKYIFGKQRKRKKEQYTSFEICAFTFWS